MAIRTKILATMALSLLILAGCSDGDAVSPTMPLVADTAPPAVPTGLEAASGTSVVKLAWNANTMNDDLEGFLVYRLAFDNAYLLTPYPIAENKFVDDRPLGLACGYAVSAVDEAGNESAWQEVRYDPGLELPDRYISQ